MQRLDDEMKLRYVCPFCFSEHKIGDVEFQCDMRKLCQQPTGADGKVHPAGGGEPDDLLAKYLGEAPKNGPHHFRVPGKPSLLSMPTSAKCDWCHQVSHTRVCPSCHNILPQTVDSDQELIVALIGTRGSGKSTYVGVLIHEMIKRLFHPFNGTFQLYGPEDQRQYRDRFEQDLYRQHTTIPQTQRHVVGNSVTANRPILGTLKLESKGFLKKVVPMTLVFFDSAGEDWENEEDLNIVAKYVAQSAGVIFLIDPLSIAKVRSLINDDSAIASSFAGGDVSDPVDVINRVSNLIRAERNMKMDEKIAIPVAAAFSKLDVLEDQKLLPAGSSLSRPSPHVQLGKFDENDQQAVNMEMQSLLVEWDNGNFVDALKLNYTDYSCFAFSAFGRAPEQGNSIAPPTPKRIEDAMLWILHQRGAL